MKQIITGLLLIALSVQAHGDWEGGGNSKRALMFGTPDFHSLHTLGQSHPAGHLPLPPYLGVACDSEGRDTGVFFGWFRPVMESVIYSFDNEPAVDSGVGDGDSSEFVYLDDERDSHQVVSMEFIKKLFNHETITVRAWPTSGDDKVFGRWSLDGLQQEMEKSPACWEALKMWNEH